MIIFHHCCLMRQFAVVLSVLSFHVLHFRVRRSRPFFGSCNFMSLALVRRIQVLHFHRVTCILVALTFLVFHFQNVVGSYVEKSFTARPNHNLSGQTLIA